MVQNPISIEYSSYTAGLSSDSFTTEIFFFEELNIVANYRQYESGDKRIRLYGGKQEDRIKVEEYLSTRRYKR